METGGRLSFLHPLAPQFRVRPEMGLVGKVYLRPRPPCLVPQGGVLRHERFPLGIVSLDQPLLGTLWHEPQAVEVVKGNCAKERTDILADVTGGRVTPVVITARLDSAQSAQAYTEAVRVFVIPYS